ncbi:MAG: hypothetical protein V8T48_02695 [Oscillospiraceae bacterium]
MFGGEDFEKEVDRGTGRSGGDWHCRGRFPSLEAIKPVTMPDGGSTARWKFEVYDSNHKLVGAAAASDKTI